MSGYVLCKVSRGMFSDERVVEFHHAKEQMAFQVSAEYVTDVDDSGNGKVQVWILSETSNQQRLVVLPTSSRDAIQIDSRDIVTK